MCYIKIIVSNKTTCASKLLRPKLVSPLAIAEGIIAEPQVSQQKVANSFFRCRQCIPGHDILVLLHKQDQECQRFQSPRISDIQLKFMCTSK